jgi:ketosteroid isomerase-like protein
MGDDMQRAATCAVVAFLAGLAIGPPSLADPPVAAGASERVGGTGVASPEVNTLALEGIEKLHQQDVAATLASDPKLLALLWTDDAVRIEPGGPAEVGKRAINSSDERQMRAHPGLKTLAYKPTFSSIGIQGDWAIEWGYFDSTFQESPDRPAKSFRGNILRVLRRQKDGSWKFSHVIWTPAE